MIKADLVIIAARKGLTLRTYPIYSTGKCAVSGCDSPKGKTKFFCKPWVERHILETI